MQLDSSSSDIANPKRFLSQCVAMSCQAGSKSCRVAAGSAFSDVDLALSDASYNAGSTPNAQGIKDCAGYSCSQLPQNTYRLPASPQYDLAIYASNATNATHFIDQCAAFSCTVDHHDYRVVDVDHDIAVADPARYTSCTASNVLKPRYAATKNGSGNLTTVTTVDCSSYGPKYQPFAAATDVSGDLFCGKNLDTVSLPGEVSRQLVGPSTPGTSNHTSGPHGSPRTKAQVATEKGHQEAHMTSFNQLTSNAGGELRRERYVYRKYPADHPFRTQKVDFKEQAEGTKSVVEGSDDHRTAFPENGPLTTKLTRDTTWTQNVKEEKVANSSGRKRDCDGAKEETFGMDAKTFLARMRHHYPTLNVVAHTIAHLTNKSCDGLQETNIAVAKQYVELSDLTKGVKEDICSDSFAPFVKTLTEVVKNQPIRDYGIPADVAAKILLITVKGSGQVLPPASYAVVPKEGKPHLVFTPDAPLDGGATLVIEHE